MQTLEDVSRTLRRRNRKNYRLLCGCCFFSVLLITAYVTMMRSPTVLSVLPEGGDSRKQVMMIFALAVLGCAVFTLYASGLFFRSKSRETGVFLALGASRPTLRRTLYRELAVISLGSCAAGALLGTPLAWGLWQIFRLCVVDTQEMALSFDPQAYLIALAFSLFVILMLFFSGSRFIRRTNIIDIVNESRKSEPIHAVRHWYGWAGILLMAAGGLLGYLVPGFCVTVLHWYPPEGFSAIFYAPLVAGLYMVLLHTVVNGWSRRGKGRYHNIISTSMMKFQGRQTVRNMLVITVLIAGSYFAAFYTPMLGTGSAMSFRQRPTDYAYHWRADQDIPGEAEVRALAEQYGVTITSWAQAPMIRLGTDGYEHVETEGVLGTTWDAQYRELLASDLFLSESSYEALTGESLDLPPGVVAGIFDADGSGQGVFGGGATLLTNPITGKTLSVTPGEGLRNVMLFGRYVMNDQDYAAMSQGLTADWQESIALFNVEHCSETYAFAKALFYEIVDRSGPEVARMDSWDPVRRQQSLDAGEPYLFDPGNLSEHGFPEIDYSQRDSSAFRMYWQYMPQFRVLDQADFVKTTAVFLMLFIFIAILCFAAVIVIAYTRSMTLALASAQVYEDLRKLGASGAYLRRCIRGQLSRVWGVPIAIGTVLILAFYTMILYFNGDPAAITASEAAGLGNCALLVLAFSAFFYLLYRLTLRKAREILHLSAGPRHPGRR